MNERQEATADVLGKLTVLGTIVLPMNIITGLWGMNCLVPGQDAENLNWFWSSTYLLILLLYIFLYICFFLGDSSHQERGDCVCEREEREGERTLKKKKKKRREGLTLRSIRLSIIVTASLLFFGICCYFIAKRVYGIV